MEDKHSRSPFSLAHPLPILFHLFLHIPSRYSIYSRHSRHSQNSGYCRVESLCREVALHDLTTERRIEGKPAIQALSPEPQAQPYFISYI